MELHYDYDDGKNNRIVHSKFIKNNETIIHEYIDNICGNHHRIEEHDGKYYLTLGGNTIASYDYGELCHIINNYEYEMKIKELQHKDIIAKLEKRKIKKDKINRHLFNIGKKLIKNFCAVLIICLIFLSYCWPAILFGLDIFSNPYILIIILIINAIVITTILNEFLGE